MMSTHRKSRELDGFSGLENSFLAETQSHPSPFALFLLMFTYSYVAHVKYLDKKEEMEVKVTCSAQSPKGKEPFCPFSH